MIKSPFLILKDFISPLDCENILDTFGTHYPDTNENNVDIKTILAHPLYENRMWQVLSKYFDYIENYYSVEVDSVSKMDVEWYPARSVQEPSHCDNSIYSNKKWKRVIDYDFTVIIFLKDFNNNRNFDDDFECYGGQLEFLNHQFSINPVRGTAIVFPSNQHFLHSTKSPDFGDMFQLKLHLICDPAFEYNQADYQGNYKLWFDSLI
jgi:hypothetical protein